MRGQPGHRQTDRRRKRGRARPKPLAPPEWSGGIELKANSLGCVWGNCTELNADCSRVYQNFSSADEKNGDRLNGVLADGRMGVRALVGGRGSGTASSAFDGHDVKRRLRVLGHAPADLSDVASRD